MTLLTRLSLANRAVIALVTVLVVGVGLFATGSLKQELVPSTQEPGALVMLSQPGTSPKTLDEQTVTPVANAIKSVAGVDEVRATSSSGQAQISATWAFGADSAAITREIESAVSSTIATLPQRVSSEVLNGSTDGIPVLVLAASSDDGIDVLGDRINRVLVPRLAGVEGVRTVTVTGRTSTQVVVTLKPEALADHRIDAEAVKALLGSSGLVVPAGTSLDGDIALAVEVGQENAGLDDIANLPIPSQTGPVPLSDLATVELAPVDRSSYSRADGRPSLGIVVTKTPAANAVQVSHAVAAIVAESRSEIGSNVAVTTIFDQATMVESSIHDLSVEGGLGLLFAVLVILVFLFSVRATIITAISIPLSLLIAVIGLWAGGNSLNIFTLAALTVAVGRVVDDSIVVIENIIRRSGGRLVTAEGVRESVAEVAGAITASTLTTVAVFLPVAFIGGFTGELFRPFATAVSIALLASLLVSLTIVPVLALWIMRRPSRRTARETGAEDVEHSRKVTRLQRAYLPSLRFAIRKPIVTVLLASLLFVGSIASAGLLKTDLIGSFADPRAVQVTQDLPLGTSLDATDAEAERVEAILANAPEVETYQTTVGDGASNRLSVSVRLTAESEPDTALASLRSALAPLESHGQITIGSQGGSAAGSDITVIVTGGTDDELRAASEDVRKALEGIDGLGDIRSDLAAEQPILTVKVNRTAAATQGFSQSDVGAAIAAAITGERVGTVVVDGSSQEIIVRSQETDGTPESIAALSLPISAIQQARAQKEATDRLAAEQEALSTDARREAENQARAQLADLAHSRSRSVADLAALGAQLAHLQANPPATGSGTPATTDDIAAQEYARSLVELQSAVAAASSGITAIDQQLASSREAQARADAQQAVSDRLAAEQKALENLRANPALVSDIATVSREDSVSTITRIDGERSVTISAKPTGSDLGAASAAVTAALDGIELPDGVSATLGGATVEQEDSFAQLGLAMLVAIALVYIVMVATFRSLLQPLVLLVSVPFAATGAIAGLLVTNTPLGIPALIGLLMLIGIVVTNAIVLIDLINRRRREGDAIDDAVLSGAGLRLRPIIMTASATIFALLPMAIGVTGGGIFISKSLAIVVIGGLISSTLLTLLIVPALYVIVERARERRSSRRFDGGSDEAAGAVDGRAGAPSRGAAVPV